MLTLNATVQVNPVQEDGEGIDVGSEWKVLAMKKNKTLIIENVITNYKISNVPCSTFGMTANDVALLL